MFFNQLESFKHNLAAADENERLTYSQLAEKCNEKQSSFTELNSAKKKQLFVILCHNTVPTLINYLSVLRAGHCAMLVDSNTTDHVLQRYCHEFQPQAILDEDLLKPSQEANTEAMVEEEIAEEIALLLSTSGSTGTAKHVALSYMNLNANAESICQYLPIEETDNALCALPIFYSYGLSMVNSHLAKGACCTLTHFGPMDREYWRILETENISSLGGVPYTYEMLLRLRFTSKHLPRLRYFTQAGGKLSHQRVTQLADYARQQNKQFFIMYGQTEATARIAYLDPDKSLLKPESIGQAIPSGSLSLIDDQGSIISQCGKVGELVYQGANVMLGYVNNFTQLCRLSQKDEVLNTGDLAYFDEQGDYFITGRVSRFIKMFGNRVSLDQIEFMLNEQGIQAYACGNDEMLVIGMLTDCVSDDRKVSDIKQWVGKLIKLHHSVIKMLVLENLPISANGKKDYQAVLKLAQGDDR